MYNQSTIFILIEKLITHYYCLLLLLLEMFVAQNYFLIIR